jgi:hypothetical protein
MHLSLDVVLTRGHVESTAATIVIRGSLGGSQSKIPNVHLLAFMRREYVFRLQVSVKNPQRVQVFHSVDDLKEDFLDQAVITEILRRMQSYKSIRLSTSRMRKRPTRCLSVIIVNRSP